MNTFTIKITNNDTGEFFFDVFAGESVENALRKAHNIANGIDWGQTGIAGSCTVDVVCKHASDAASLVEELTTTEE